ncbi:Uu.00g027440.m01.CDS01 [Anthostomella pinea]|uniref:Uu.00g027440.m01.CDS01 n=1 Tax=Anthostomella pinea TaxID=933095 RepID=A0AAI8YCL6_9PEZI|nr:Uu.00g027440.m01.CDS01 [Anthostomella pinea]
MQSLALLLPLAAAATAVGVTEIANITLVANSSIAVFDVATQVILQQPGALTVRTSRLVENADSFRMFVDWESVEACQAFANSQSYEEISHKVSPVIAATPVTYNVELSPFPPFVFNNDEGQGVYTEARKANVTQAVMNFLNQTKDTAEGFTGQTAMGWVVEGEEIPYNGTSCRVFVLGVGWESVADHEAWMETDAYKEYIPELWALDGLLGIELRHVSNKVVHAEA